MPMTDAGRPIDILQDFASLYAREEMMAFFDFGIDRGGAPPVSGLCRLSKPKNPRAGGQYLSLTFVVDTPDDAARGAAQAALDRIAPEPLRSMLPEVREVVAVPSIDTTPESYVVQLDLMMHADPTRPFLSGQLVPAIARLSGLKVVELVWWDNPPVAPKGPAAAGPVTAGSLVARLRRYLKEQLGGE
jgi:hypothetical protein